MKNKIKLDATYYFIMLMLGSTCFGHHYVHHQELTTIAFAYHIGRLVLELLLAEKLIAGRMDESPDRRLLQPSVRTLIRPMW